MPAAANLRAEGHARFSPTLFGCTWADGAVFVRKTGVRLEVGFPLIWEILHWATYLPVLAAVAVIARLHRMRRPFSIWYTPDRAGPWYLVRGAALWAGYRAARTASEADAAFYFDDSTQGATPADCGRALLNGACTDISKSHVAEIFTEVFGYPLRVDPRCTVGPIVEKAEKNGVHDGGIVDAPLSPRAGYTYQRLIDTTGPDGLVHDLRTPCVGGAPVVVWEKTKPISKRFTIHNSRAVLRDPASVYTPAELKLIAQFTGRMGLDWGGLDILRDREDGRIYIVDVNKTDLGPVIALGWADKLRSMHRLARALSALVEPSKDAIVEDGVMLAASRRAPVTPRSTAWARRVAPWLPLVAILFFGAAWTLLHPQNALLDGLKGHGEQLRAWGSAHPVAALLLFVLIYATAVSLMLPVGLILIFAGGYILGPAGGALASMIGATLAALASYGMARLAPLQTARRFERRFPQLGRLQGAFIDHPFRYTLSLRLMPLTPFTLVGLAAGLNRISWGAFALGTLLGVAPECVIYSIIGHGLQPSAGLGDHAPSRTALLMSLGAAAMLVAITTCRREKPRLSIRRAPPFAEYRPEVDGAHMRGGVRDRLIVRRAADATFSARRRSSAP